MNPFYRHISLAEIDVLEGYVNALEEMYKDDDDKLDDVWPIWHNAIKKWRKDINDYHDFIESNNE